MTQRPFKPNGFKLNFSSHPRSCSCSYTSSSSLFTAVSGIVDNGTSIPSLCRGKNLKVTPDCSLFCTITSEPFINSVGSTGEASLGSSAACRLSFSPLSLHASPCWERNLPRHPVSRHLHWENEGAKTMDKGGWTLIIHSTERALLPSHDLQRQPQALDHSDALCHLSYQMETVPDHRVLVRIKWDDICQVLSLRSSTQWMIVTMVTMMRFCLLSESISYLFCQPHITPHSSMLPAVWLPWLPLLLKPSLSCFPHFMIFPHFVPFTSPYLILLSKLFYFFQKDTPWNHHLWGLSWLCKASLVTPFPLTPWIPVPSSTLALHMPR